MTLTTWAPTLRLRVDCGSVVMPWHSCGGSIHLECVPLARLSYCYLGIPIITHGWINAALRCRVVDGAMLPC